MNISATLFGQFIVASVVIIGISSYLLGKRKTNTPRLAGLIGVLLAFMPPLGFIYLACMVLKNDVPTPATQD
ncbi:hypothetical protein LJ739_11290 [Aestuariibacter halophilus]|uniref:Cardiolipin synthase N-terminal domain-containing protein n=1 Tax=Fluctibacter halophilus TaxID=226011 RepID=A0ABS8G9G4_9ALTE|nr:hypothetical protein [Aestuariibacter halophilus]MCC2616826.1 hypothetical protein [Aestuariibacter halophilus]